LKPENTALTIRRACSCSNLTGLRYPRAEIGNWELDRRSGLRLHAWNYDEPAIALPDNVTTNLKRSEVLTPDRDKGEERDHQATTVTDGVFTADRIAGCWSALVHKLLPDVEELEAGNDGRRCCCGRR